MQKTLHRLTRPLAAPAAPAWRPLAALALRLASRQLARLARLTRRLARQRAAVQSLRTPACEFYAEAGAPEGALYLDGELVGYLPGITRL